MYSIGKNQHIAVIMLNTKFPRLLGDIGNAQTYNNRVKYYTLEQACINNVVVNENLSDSLKNKFIEKAKLAESEGAEIIFTSCGFLVTIQQKLSAAVNIPVITSSLTLLPWLGQIYQVEEICIVTADASKLNSFQLQKFSNQCDKYLVEGMELKSTFANIILADNKYDDEQFMCRALEKEVLEVVLAAIKKNSKIKVFLLECTNLMPYSNVIEKTTQRRVVHLNKLINIT